MFFLQSYKKEEVEKSPSPEVIASFFREAGLSELKTCIVKHCFNSFGLSFKTNNGYKVSYSGDCMPTRAFIDIGKKISSSSIFSKLYSI